MYNFNHLYYFYVTAKSGGVTAAAGHLRISQPSLSTQLKVLESELGLKLLQKTGRTVELTREGLVIYVRRSRISISEISEIYLAI
jgi:LysR family transcriptional activator of nhaA